MDEMPPVDESKVKIYPMVWKNEVTGKPAFMVHNFIVQKIFMKTSPDSEEKIIDDVDEVRAFLFPFSRKMLEPENILMAPYEEGDIAVWNNRVSLS
jgi:alpha-ketoglutarate-dependent taurine dioxygenase